MNIHVLASGDVISYFFLYPLLLFEEELKRRGVEIKYFSRLNTSLFCCDAVMIDNRWFTPLWKDHRDTALGLLEKIRKNQERVIWLDVTDSTGAAQFQVLPYVDRYLKKQILKDRALYQKRFYGARIYTDYYQEHFGLPQEDVYRDEPLDSAFLPKLRVSWNLGLGPCEKSPAVNTWIRRLPYFLKRRMARGGAMNLSPFGARNNDVCFRGSERYNNSALTFQRREIIKRLKKRGVATEPLPRSRYLHELRSTKLCVSPFGAGEICFRDFEIFLEGGVLLKPDMSHLETWPDFYQPGQTYEPFQWDFSDFDRKIDGLLRQPEVLHDVSGRAQRFYAERFTRQGEQEFCDRFHQLIAWT